MAIVICLLRGINVGGKRMKMAALREMFADLGFPNAKTILASGNVIFESDEQNQEKLVTTIENAIQSTFGFDSKIILRTAQQLEAIIAKKPSYKEEVAGNKLLVTFLRDAPTAEAMQSFDDFHQTEEEVHILDREIFIHYVNGAGQSKLSNNVIEKKLDVVGTARNWNTVLKLQKLVQEMSS